jgi:tetratricopeptide (TPR) repeat protein
MPEAAVDSTQPPVMAPRFDPDVLKRREIMRRAVRIGVPIGIALVILLLLILIVATLGSGQDADVARANGSRPTEQVLIQRPTNVLTPRTADGGGLYDAGDVPPAEDAPAPSPVTTFPTREPPPVSPPPATATPPPAPPAVRDSVPATQPRPPLETIPAWDAIPGSPAATQSAEPQTQPTAHAATQPAQSSLPAMSRPTPPAAAAPSHAEDQVNRGVVALRASDLEVADSAFRQALALDVRNSRAYHGRGLVALLRNRPEDAIAFLETAMRCAPRPPPRNLYYNLAVAHLRQNPMRAARYVMDYLSNSAAPPDEEMANALGAALNVAGYSARNNPYYDDAREFYFKYDQKLEKARTDGMKRWGTQWLPESEAAAKWDAYRKAAQAVMDARRTLSASSVPRDKKYVIAKSEAEAKQIRDAYRQAGQVELAARADLKTAQALLNNIEWPPLPTDLQPVLDP